MTLISSGRSDDSALQKILLESLDMLKRYDSLCCEYAAICGEVEEVVKRLSLRERVEIYVIKNQCVLRIAPHHIDLFEPIFSFHDDPVRWEHRHRLPHCDGCVDWTGLFGALGLGGTCDTEAVDDDE